MKITLIRHGEVEIQYIGLSLKGKEEALLLAKAFTCKQFDLVYCSDLRRAKETIAPFI